MTLKDYWNKNKRGLLLLITAVGLVITVLGVLELLFEFEMIDFEVPLMKQVDNYAWFFVIIGGIVLIGGYLYFREYNKNYKKFNELMEKESKAAFVRHIVEIEELAVSLGPDYEKQVMEKRKKLKVKTR